MGGDLLLHTRYHGHALSEKDNTVSHWSERMLQRKGRIKSMTKRRDKQLYTQHVDGETV